MENESTISSKAVNRERGKRNLDSISSVSSDSDPVKHFAYIDHSIIRENLGKILPTDSEYKVACKISSSLKTMKEIQDQSAISLKKFRVSYESALNNDGKFLLDMGIDRLLASRFCAYLMEKEIEKHKKRMCQFVFPPPVKEKSKSKARYIIRDLDFLWDDNELPDWK